MGPRICMTSLFSDTPLNFKNPEIRNQMLLTTAKNTIILLNLSKSIVLPHPSFSFTSYLSFPKIIFFFRFFSDLRIHFLKIKIFISLDIGCQFVEYLFKIKIYIFQFLKTKKGDNVSFVYFYKIITFVWRCEKNLYSHSYSTFSNT